MRPPEATLPSSAGSLSTVERIRLRSSAIEIDGSLAMTSAATPDTYGVAIDVPEASRYPSRSHVERMAFPGAATCTLLIPKLENDATVSFRSRAATLIRLGRL